MQNSPVAAAPQDRCDGLATSQWKSSQDRGRRRALSTYAMMRLRWERQEMGTTWKTAKGLLSRAFHVDGHAVCLGSLYIYSVT